MAGDVLARRGWHLSQEGLQQCSEDGKKGADQTEKNALDTDLKEIGEKWLPEELCRGRVDYLQGPAVLQIQKLRNIAAPKENEQSQAAPRLLKLCLTDGHLTCIAIETENLKNISLNTAPGSKVLLDGTVGVENSFLLLSNKNFKLLGGRVDQMAENWEFKRKLAKQNRSNIQSEGGPPPFVPFGKKIQQILKDTKKVAEKKENFKSLGTNKEKTEETEFDHQRQATIAEALQAKEGGKTKTFGAKGSVNDKDVARIVEMGFTADQAMEALKQSGGDVTAATHMLLSNGESRDRYNDRGGRGGGRGYQGGRFERNERAPGGDHGNRFDRGDRGDRAQGSKFESSERKDQKPGGRGRRGRDEDFEDSASSRPSGPATLFDFLTTKIPVKEEKKVNGVKETTNTSRGSKSNTENRNPNSSSNSVTSKQQQQQQQQQQFSSDDTASHSHPNRKQNLPPRLVNKQDLNPRREDFKQYSNQSRNTSSQPAYNNISNSQDRSQFNSSKRPESGNIRKPSERNQNRPDSSGTQNRAQNPTRQNYYDEDNSSYDSRQDSHFVNNKQSKPKDRQTNPKDRRNEGQSEKWTSDSGRMKANDGQNNWSRDTRAWKEGDMCLAKYWEDNRFYPSRIEKMAVDVGTCIVTFVEYGNAEEVLLTDIRPMKTNWQTNGPMDHFRQFNNPRNPHQPNILVSPPQMPLSAPPPYPGDDVLNSAPIGTMEFRRGGTGMYERSQQHQKPRPSQKLYQPPVYHSRQNPS